MPLYLQARLMFAHRSKKGRVMRFFGNTKFLSERRRLELYPPFFFMRVKVLEISDDWRKVRVRLPLTSFSINPGGVVFGGYQAALADPIPALACGHIFKGWVVWTRSMHIDFVHGGSSDLELNFEFPRQTEEKIRTQLKADGRANAEFEYAYVRDDGVRCTLIRNTVAIRAASSRTDTRHEA